MLFAILQKYDFSSKSQLSKRSLFNVSCCLRYCKSTIFQANHNNEGGQPIFLELFVILQKYDFSSKSQLELARTLSWRGCLWYCKSTIFQANHNSPRICRNIREDVCDTAKVRFFKQITTDFSRGFIFLWCLWYCKSTIFQANHNILGANIQIVLMFVILQKYDFSSKSQCLNGLPFGASSCSRYCKSAIFQANHKWLSLPTYGEWWCAWPSPLAVGRGRCVGYLFGAYYLFLLKCLVSWFYFVSSH